MRNTDKDGLRHFSGRLIVSVNKLYAAESDGWTLLSVRYPIEKATWVDRIFVAFPLSSKAVVLWRTSRLEVPRSHKMGELLDRG